MAERPFQLETLTLRLGDETWLGELPGVGAVWCADSRLKLEAGLTDLARMAIADTAAETLARVGPVVENAVVADVRMSMEPPPRQSQWTSPVELNFQVVCGQVGALHVARVPVLGIEVFGADEGEVRERLPAHIRAAHQRDGAGKSLARLIALPETLALELGRMDVLATVRDPTATPDAGEKKKSLLDEVTTDLTFSTEPAWEVEESVAQLAGFLGGQPPQHVLLVGPAGVGKSAVVRELVRRRASFGFRETPFRATSGSRLISGMSGFGEWQERLGELVREAAKRHAILHFGSLLELLQTGRHIYNQQGIASFLRPHLGRGEFLAIAECTPEQIPVLEREDPHLLELFVPLVVVEPDAARGRRILAAAAPEWPAATLDEIDALHRRYATTSAYPGRPLRFLRNLRRDHADAAPPAPAEVIGAFTRETGLPRVMLDDAVPLDLAETRGWFEARVIGQPSAVAQVTALLAVVKKRLARPRQPLASLLFIGPTGVGKTEMARSLAGFLFGDPERVTRFDMSEFATPFAVQRLIGGRDGEGQLTARVREEPFCVLLFDEFEKAHPLFFDLLLPVLGEGRLTDAAGRLADFSNAVIILTSNLGASTFASGRLGFAAGANEQRDAREHFTAEVRKAMRPELFNRFDRIVPFSPLDRATVQAIAERELMIIRTRDGLRFHQLEIAPGVAEHFAQTGFDPRYGARPLKRAVERELLFPLAERLNRYPADHLLHAVVRVAAGGLQVEVGSLGAAGDHPETKSLGRQVKELSARRREMQLLQHCGAVQALANERLRLAAAHQRQRRRTPDLPEPRRLRELTALEARLGPALTALEALETEVAVALHERSSLTRAGFASDGQRALAAVRALSLEVYEQHLFPQAQRALVAVFGEEKEWLLALARAVLSTARHLDHSVRLVALESGLPAAGEKAPEVVPVPRLSRVAVKARTVIDPGAYLAQQTDGLLGCIFHLHGPSALPLWIGEAGWHAEHLSGKKRRHALIEVDQDVGEYAPPEGMERRGGLTPGDVLRQYHPAPAGTVSDRALGVLRWTGALGNALHDCVTARLERALRNMREDAS